MAKAISSLKLAIQYSKPSDSWRSEAYYFLGSAAQSLGKKTLAIDSYKNYLQIAPPGSGMRKEASKQLQLLGYVPPKPRE